MKLTVYSARDFNSKLKVTIQSTGRLGFTAETAESLQLSPDTFIKIAHDEEQDDSLFLIVCNQQDGDGFKLNCVSKYYSLPTTSLFEQLGYDFVNNTVIFDLYREPTLDAEADGTVYKMKKREMKKKKKEVDMK